LFRCHLPTEIRESAQQQNARTIRRIATQLEQEPNRVYPYGAVITFGYGSPDQAQSSIADWRPGDRCHRLSQDDIDRMGVMTIRARRAAEALQAGVAPLIIVSGGVEHSRMVEAFALLFLLRCAYGISEERVLVEPCAEHTHTNVRNSGTMLVAMGARTGYIVTDDGLQRQYLEDYGGFEWIGGSIDDRAQRDWGYLLGTWRRASIGMNAGFWYSPYRFWAERRDGAGGFTCLGGRSEAR
jgi:hypothetical protein